MRIGIESITEYYDIRMNNNYRNKKILDIVTTPYFVPKGSAIRADSILRKLSKYNDVDLLVYPVGRDPEYKNVKTIRICPEKKISLEVSEVSIRKISLDIKMFFKAFSLMKKNKYDIIHCEDFEAAFFVGFPLSLFFRKPMYVYDLHNTIADNLKITNKPEFFIKIAKFISRTIYSRFDLVITNWDVYRNVSKKKRFLLYDETNVNIRKIRIPTKNKYLAYSGNFQKYQGVEEFVKVYGEVKPDYDLVLIGKWTNEIKNLVKKLKIEDKVYFTGVLDIEESNYILTNAEMCLIPRISGDQQGLKMVHHIMLGKASLATDIPANKELLKDGYNAVLYLDDIELMKILRNINNERLNIMKLNTGILETQKRIRYIWSEEYFNSNYFRS